MATHSPTGEGLRSATQRRHAAERKAWQPANNSDWVTKETYREKILPRLAGITVPTISAALGISEPYATDIRAGRRIPHPTLLGFSKLLKDSVVGSPNIYPGQGAFLFGVSGSRSSAFDSTPGTNSATDFSFQTGDRSCVSALTKVRRIGRSGTSPLLRIASAFTSK